jgi:hypothetical protein
MDLSPVAFRPCDNCDRPICEAYAIDLGVKLEPIIGRDLAAERIVSTAEPQDPCWVCAVQ